MLVNLKLSHSPKTFSKVIFVFFLCFDKEFIELYTDFTVAICGSIWGDQKNNLSI